MQHLDAAIQIPETSSTSVWLVMRALFELLLIDVKLVHGFPAMYQAVRQSKLSTLANSSPTAEEVCHAVDLACVFYFKEVLCLQRSAAATRLLRQRGIPAELVIGVQTCPFRAHSWVEIAGRVVNDKPYVPEMYSVMERC